MKGMYLFTRISSKAATAIGFSRTMRSCLGSAFVASRTTQFGVVAAELSLSIPPVSRALTGRSSLIPLQTLPHLDRPVQRPQVGWDACCRSRYGIAQAIICCVRAVVTVQKRTSSTDTQSSRF